MKGIRAWVWAAALLAAAGCATSTDQRYWLDSSLMAYQGALRWGEYEKAYAMRAPDAEPDAPNFERLGAIRISSYDVVDEVMSSDGTEVRQRVDIRYYHADTMIEKAQIYRPVWRLDAANKRWLLMSPLPQLR